MSNATPKSSGFQETWPSPTTLTWTPLSDLPALQPHDEEEEDVVTFLSQEMGMEVDEVEDQLYNLAREARSFSHQNSSR